MTEPEKELLQLLTEQGKLTINGNREYFSKIIATDGKFYLMSGTTFGDNKINYTDLSKEQVISMLYNFFKSETQDNSQPVKTLQQAVDYWKTHKDFYG